MKITTILCYLLFLAGVALFLMQMWFHILGPELFVKIVFSDMALFAVVFVLGFLIRESKDSNKINNNNGLD